GCRLVAFRNSSRSGRPRSKRARRAFATAAWYVNTGHSGGCDRRSVVVRQTRFRAPCGKVQLRQTLVRRAMVRTNVEDLLEQPSCVFVVALVPSRVCIPEQVCTLIGRQPPMSFGALAALPPCGFTLSLSFVAHLLRKVIVFLRAGDRV